MAQPPFEVKSGHFRLLFDLALVMKVDPYVVMVLSVKFGDHRRWLELEVHVVHVPPLRAARGSTSNLLWRCSLSCYVVFSITNILILSLVKLVKFGYLSN